MRPRQILNLTYGNRPELFGAGSPTYSGGTTGSIGTGGGAGGSGGGFKYDIPSEALSDEKFARMIEEAEKYLGIPTTKPEPQLHGFGLANIRLILEKYSGEFKLLLFLAKQSVAKQV